MMHQVSSWKAQWQIFPAIILNTMIQYLGQIFKNQVVQHPMSIKHKQKQAVRVP